MYVCMLCVYVCVCIFHFIVWFCCLVSHLLYFVGYVGEDVYVKKRTGDDVDVSLVCC